jgi:chromosome partitioning protein
MFHVKHWPFHRSALGESVANATGAQASRDLPAAASKPKQYQKTLKECHPVESPETLGEPGATTGEPFSSGQLRHSMPAFGSDSLASRLATREGGGDVSRETSRADDAFARINADDDSPLAAELLENERRRRELAAADFPRPAKTRVITVSNQKGGVGKTTTSVNLAGALASRGARVLVIDSDPQGNASTALGVDHRSGTPSIYEVLLDEVPIAHVMQQCPDIDTLWCVPATIDLAGADIELVSAVRREYRLHAAVQQFLANEGRDFDYIFVDCPPSLGLLTLNAMVVATEVLIPIQCEYYALEGLTQLIKTVEMVRKHLNPQIHVSTIVLTMYDSRTNLAREVATEVRTHFPEQTLEQTVPRAVRVSEAPSFGQTVITYDPHSNGAIAYLAIAQEVAKRGQQLAESESAR